MCQPEKQVEGSHWRCADFRNDIAKTGKQTQRKCYTLFYPLFLGKKSKSNGNTIKNKLSKKNKLRKKLNEQSKIAKFCLNE